MKDNKDRKKPLAIAGVGIILLGLGAFHFLGGSDGGPVVHSTLKKADDASSVASGKDQPLKNPSFAGDLAERDPFLDLSQPAEIQQPAPAARIPAPHYNRSPRSLGGNFGGASPLPPAGGIGLAPAAAPEPAFGYRLSGVIIGKRPAAVFTDSSGAQRLVPLGGSLDGDASVVAVKKGQATVKFRGKKLRLSLGGPPDAS